MIYSSRDYNETTALFENMQSSGKFGTKFDEPFWIELN